MATDGDLPLRSGRLNRWHLRLGRIAVLAKGILPGKTTLGVRLIALDDRGRVLLVRHSYMPGLHLPGGGVDPGESCRTAAIREAREEGAIALQHPPELVHIYWNRNLRRRDHVVLFLARGVHPTGERPAPGEILSAAFHDPDALPEDTTPATRARLAEALRGAPLPDIW